MVMYTIADSMADSVARSLDDVAPFLAGCSKKDVRHPHISMPKRAISHAAARDLP